MKNRFEILVGKPEGKEPLIISRCRWEENIKMDLKQKMWTRFIGSG
jgi:hypothetical protein